MSKGFDSLDLLLGQVKKSDNLAGKTDNLRRYLKAQKRIIQPIAKSQLQRAKINTRLDPMTFMIEM